MKTKVLLSFHRRRQKILSFWEKKLETGIAHFSTDLSSRKKNNLLEKSMKEK